MTRRAGPTNIGRCGVLAAALVAGGSGSLGCGGEDVGRPVDLRSGGDTTVQNRTSNAYSFPAPNMDAEEFDRHRDGDAAFEAAFVTGGAPVNNGLGPLYNNTACDRCHGRDGRGLPRIGVGASSQSLVRVSLPEGDEEVPGGPASVPGMGTQLQNHAVFGSDPEARITLEWRERSGTYGDGIEYSLREPVLRVSLPGGEPLDEVVLTSLRQPPAVFGLGLLEAIDETTLEAWADPDDADGDGVSGRINRVWDVQAREAVVGRFGHKANTPNLLQQAAAAYFNDMGVTNPIFVDPETEEEDLDLDTVELAAFYTRTLAVPGRLEPKGEAAEGEELFESFGCASCHRPQAVTGQHELAMLSDQEIQPYTDLLLHDMGDDLADGRPDFLADAREWRTAPLWGIGLVQTVQPGSSFLHDGRARDLAEAILWHGGEAEAARESFRTASALDRNALLAFLASL